MSAIDPPGGAPRGSPRRTPDTCSAIGRPANDGRGEGPDHNDNTGGIVAIVRSSQCVGIDNVLASILVITNGRVCFGSVERIDRCDDAQGGHQVQTAFEGRAFHAAIFLYMNVCCQKVPEMKDSIA